VPPDDLSGIHILKLNFGRGFARTSLWKLTTLSQTPHAVGLKGGGGTPSPFQADCMGSLGERRKLPQRGSGKAAAKIEF